MDRDKLGSPKAHPPEGSDLASLEAALEAELDGRSDRMVGLILGDRYRIVSQIDSGGIGVVYLAEQLQLKRRVAIKVLHQKFAQNKEYLQRFEREAMAASKATHPSCIAVLDFGTIEDRPYLVMEYVEGPLVTDLIEQGAIALQDVVAIGLQLLEALGHAHRHGIVHRDVKPDNVMLCYPEEAGTRLKLLDFGLAKHLQVEAGEDHMVTRAGTVCGTPSYMSPEQAVAGEIDGRSDLYSCGVVLYQLATGRRPFLHKDMVQLIQAHLTEQPLRPRELRPEISKDLERALLRALEKEREARFQSADAFMEALRAVPEARDIDTSASGVMPVVRPGGRERLATAATVQATPSRLASLTSDDAPLDESIIAPLRPGLQVLALLFFAVVVSAGTTYALARLFPAAGAGLRGADQVQQLLARGELARAERLLRKAIARRPGDGRQHLLLGHIYCRKLWRPDALKAYRRAIARSPGLRGDPTMLRNVIGFLGKDRSVPGVTQFLQRDVGELAIPALKQAGEKHANPKVRRRVAQLLKQITGSDRSPAPDSVAPDGP